MQSYNRDYILHASQKEIAGTQNNLPNKSNKYYQKHANSTMTQFTAVSENPGFNAASSLLPVGVRWMEPAPGFHRRWPDCTD